MKNFLKFLSVLMLILSMLTVTACDGETGGGGGGGTTDGGSESGGGEGGGTTDGGSESGGGEGGGSITETCTITFEGADLEAETVDKNSSLQKPEAPEVKNDSQFVNWYTDESLTTLAVFPMTITADTTLYAKYIPLKDYFLMARDNTVGDGVLGFEYDYNWTISGTVSSLTVDGVQNGTSKYSSSNEVSYFDHHTNSGLLFNDGQIYEYRSGSTNNRIELDQNGEVVDFESETDTAAKKYDSSTFAKALFTYTEDDIKSIKKDGKGYLIKTTTNVTSVGNIILNNINHPIVEKLLETNLPDTDSEASFKVTYNGDEIATYVYDFTINVSAVILNINYTINFEKVNDIPQITLPTFNNFYIHASEINTHLSAINASINEYKNSAVSSNTFELKTGVDYGATTGSIDTTYAGESKRSNSGGGIDYINLVEVDSDLKNADLYKSSNLEDVKYVRGNLANGTVYDRIKKLVGYEDAVTADINGRGNADEFYLLLDSTFLNTSNINSVAISTKNNNTTYSLTLTKNGAFALIDYINKYATLNPFIDADIKVLGDYDKNEFSISWVNLDITIDTATGALVSVNVELEAKSNVKFVGSRDFNTAEMASISIDWSFEVTNDVDSYTAPSNAADLKY